MFTMSTLTAGERELYEAILSAAITVHLVQAQEAAGYADDDTTPSDACVAALDRRDALIDALVAALAKRCVPSSFDEIYLDICAKSSPALPLSESSIESLLPGATLADLAKTMFRRSRPSG